MIATRQRNRSIEQPPVLFRLPNLQNRKAQAEPSPEVEVAASILSGDEIRVDAAQSTVKTHQSVPYQAAPSEPVLSSPAPSEPESGLSHASESKSWMERVGSRLILCVTLIVIVSAAWLTGQRMPASKPDVLRSNPLAAADSANTSSDPAGNAVDSAVNNDSLSTSDSEALLATDRASDFSDSSGGVSLKPPQSPVLEAPQSRPTSELPPASLVIEELPREPAASPSSPSQVFNTVSVQSRPADEFYAADTDPSDALPLSAPEPAANLTAPAISVADAAPASEPQVATQSGVLTQTPHEPAIDPAVLVPWVLENGAPPQPVRSATPNPIVDWSRYFPLNNAPPVRSVSATESDSSATAVQQTLYPQSPTGRP